MSKKNIIFPNFLKIYSAFAVILLHIVSYYITNFQVESFTWTIMNIYSSLTRNAVPLFIMISGMLVLNPNKDFNLFRFFKRNILKMFFILFLFSFLYFYFFTSRNFMDFIKAFYNGNSNYHLWYLYMLIGLYILTPIIRNFIKGASKKDLEYFIIIFSLFFFIFKNIPEIKGLYYLKIFTDKILVFNSTSYVFYYILGYYLYKYDFNKYIKYILYFLGFSSILITIYLTKKNSLLMGKLDQTYYSLDRLNILLYSTSTFVFFKEYFNKRISKFSFKLASSSFTVYLLHEIGIRILNNYSILSSLSKPYLYVPLLAILIYFSCYVIHIIFEFIENNIIKKLFSKHIK